MNPVHKVARIASVDGRVYGATSYYACKAVAMAAVDPKNGFADVCRQWGASLLRFADVTATARGADGVDWSRPTVLMANHASLYDIPVLFHVIPANLNFLAKKEIEPIPLLGWAMKKGGFVFIDRRDPVRSKASIDLAAAKVGAGHTVAIFPEGTRSKNGVLKGFKKGGFVLAIKARAQIAPVYLDGTHDILPKDSWLVRRGHVEVRVGRPIDAARYDLDSKEGLMDEVRAELVRLAAIAPERPTGVERA